jgi:hypothetical protein
MSYSEPIYNQPPPLPEHLVGTVVDPQEQYQIPSHYDETKLVVLVRDPYWLYAYWEISRATQEYISNSILNWHEVQLLLRVYDISNIAFDGTNSNFFFDINVANNPNNWYIHVGGPNRTFCVDLGFIQTNGHFYTVARSNIVTTPRDAVSEVVDEEWMMIEEDFNRLYRLAGNFGGNSSAELVETLIQRLEREISSGAVSSLASPVKYQLPKERQFWLVLNTELIVYGATEPDARVSVQGEAIQLRPDGTFTLRFALPDGTQNIPVEARSADALDTITITPVVSKQTH